MPTNMIETTKWADNPYQPEWAAEDFLYSPDGIKKFPDHHCKMTYLLSKPFVRQFRNAVDVGCRVGEYSRYLHLDFQHVYAFDPNLWPNFRYNVDLTKVSHYTCALGDKQEEIAMYGGMHSERPNAKVKRHPCFTLDSFGLEDIDYIKIDVEGLEKRVLLGARETIEKFSPLIVIEQNGVTVGDEDRYSAKTYLESLGYREAARDSRDWDYVMVRDR